MLQVQKPLTAFLRMDFTDVEPMHIWIWGQGGKPLLDNLFVADRNDAWETVRRWNNACAPSDRILFWTDGAEISRAQIECDCAAHEAAASHAHRY
jgi:hypothetical protein